MAKQKTKVNPQTFEMVGVNSLHVHPANPRQGDVGAIFESIEHNGVYEHEMTDDDHVELCMAARNLKGMVVLSGYDNNIYREILSDWPTSSIAARAQTNAPRVEMIWINPATAARLQPQLFEVES
jgi:hypothetical protein